MEKSKFRKSQSIIKELLGNLTNFCLEGDLRHYPFHSYPDQQQQTTLLFTLKGGRHSCKEGPEQKLSMSLVLQKHKRPMKIVFQHKDLI